MGALTPIGLSVDEFWQGMMDCRSGAGPISYYDAELFATRFACELKGFDPLDYIDAKIARRVDPFTQYALVVSDQALEDAGLNSDSMTEEMKDRTGVVFGSGIGGIQIFKEQVDTYRDHGVRRISPFFIPRLIPDIASGYVSIRHGLRGPNYCVVSACATGNNNISDALMVIQRGLADVIVCGGAESAITPMGVGGFNALKALSTRNDEPERASRPFDKSRDGFVLGEGAGALILEDLEHARARGARIYAEVAGIGMSADAYHITAPDPEGRGARLSMISALRDSGIDPTEVDYLNMHGTSTPLGDVAETNAIKSVFGEHAYEMNLSSTKSMTGHLLGAAGAIEAIATILAISRNRVPPTINFEHPDPDCDLNYAPQDREVRVGVSNAFGFGGHNTTVVFRSFDED
jgi:3-oxoacyl-[acyl-carrier-protein] synthase II